MALFKNSKSGELFRQSARSAAKPASAAPAPPAEQVPAAGFPTSEDLRRGELSHLPEDEYEADPDTRFLHGEDQAVFSSNVAWLRYEHGTLYIGYKSGGHYRCDHVDAGRALEIRHAPSVGHALKELERTHGRFSKVF